MSEKDTYVAVHEERRMAVVVTRILIEFQTYAQRPKWWEVSA